MSTSPHAIVFDLDGTLVDSLEDVAESMNAVLAEAGMPPHDLDTYRRFIGDGLATLVRRAMAPGGDFESLLEAARERYAAHCLDRTRAFDGVPEMLARLRAHGLPMAVLSNKPHAMTQQVVRGLFPDVPFVAVVGERPDIPRKPDPAGAQTIAQALRVEPGRCWLVGDTPVDLETARAAGMLGVAVVWGFRSAEELRAHDPELMVDTPEQLVDLCCGA